MECLQEWPELVVPVQALSESGVSAVPDCYVKPLSDRPTGLSSPTGHEPNIPIIDLSGLSGGAVACRATIQAVAAACRDWGFFQVVNHGIGPDVIGRVRAAWRGFFDRPMEEKRRYANSPRSYEGYGSRLGVEKGAVLDWGDYYFLHLLPAEIKSQVSKNIAAILFSKKLLHRMSV